MSEQLEFMFRLYLWLSWGKTFDESYEGVRSQTQGGVPPTKEDARWRIIKMMLPENESLFSLPLDAASIVHDIILELDLAEQLHTDWPTDLIHQISIMAEEAGEIVNDITFGDRSYDDLRTELVQIAVMCLRILKNLPKEEGEA